LIFLSSLLANRKWGCISFGILINKIATNHVAVGTETREKTVIKTGKNLA